MTNSCDSKSCTAFLIILIYFRPTLIHVIITMDYKVVFSTIQEITIFSSPDFLVFVPMEPISNLLKIGIEEKNKNNIITVHVGTRKVETRSKICSVHGTKLEEISITI